MVHEYIQVSGQMETDNSSEGTFFDTERSCYAQADTADPLGESSAVQVVPSGVLRMSYSAKSVTPGEIFCFLFAQYSDVKNITRG